MSKNYAGGKPVGGNGVPFFDSPPAYAAVVTTVRDNGAASSILVLNQNTTAIEVGATGGPVFIKWLTQATVDSSVAGTSILTGAATPNFDHIIPDGVVRRFVVPIATIPASYTSVQGANRLNGLYPNMAYASGPIASVAVTQYGSSNSY